MEVSYRSRDKCEKVGEIFCKQRGEVSQSLALVLVEDFNSSNICWKYSTADRKQSRRFLEYVKDNLVTELVKEPARRGVPWICSL